MATLEVHFADQVFVVDDQDPKNKEINAGHIADRLSRGQSVGFQATDGRYINLGGYGPVWIAERRPTKVHKLG